MVPKDYLEYHEIPVYFLGNELDHQVVHDWYPDVVHIHSHGISLESFDELFSLCSHAKFVETNVFRVQVLGQSISCLVFNYLNGVIGYSLVDPKINIDR